MMRGDFVQGREQGQAREHGEPHRDPGGSHGEARPKPDGHALQADVIEERLKKRRLRETTGEDARMPQCPPEIQEQIHAA